MITTHTETQAVGVPGLVIPGHCIQDGQGFSHAGSKRNLLGFSSLNEFFIKLLDGFVAP